MGKTMVKTYITVSTVCLDALTKPAPAPSKEAVTDEAVTDEAVTDEAVTDEAKCNTVTLTRDIWKTTTLCSAANNITACKTMSYNNPAIARSVSCDGATQTAALPELKLKGTEGMKCTTFTLSKDMWKTTTLCAVVDDKTDCTTMTYNNPAMGLSVTCGGATPTAALPELTLKGTEGMECTTVTFTKDIWKTTTLCSAVDDKTACTTTTYNNPAIGLSVSCSGSSVPEPTA
ncbi:hypothetical protein ABW20_dc0105927 [Dactylellina cionopaga]|nr:hypothetical protein ABW20_dc0105927 [Dactylellina cionopaga]